MKNEKASRLIKAYLDDTATAEQKAQAETWYIKAAGEQEEPKTSVDLSTLESETLQSLRSQQKIQKPVRKLWTIGIAASVAALVVLGCFATFWFRTNQGLPANYANDIPAGGNKATLTLGNGKTINLTDVKNGKLSKQGGVQITKTADGQLVYQIIENQVSEINASTNTISTPKGGQYQLILPDGTKVWLNAASSLSYPVTFTGRGQRVVNLSGEAYFEVFKNKKHPFIVKSAKQEIKVLGTHFNISAYTNDPVVKTTLLEGSVEVNAKTILKPGEQSSFSDGQIKVTPVDTEVAVAWKNGDFMFKNEPLENIMQQIARWYNVDVVYSDPQVSNKRFGGTISKFKNVSEVLCMLELTEEVHFKVEGRRITVLSKK